MLTNQNNTIDESKLKQIAAGGEGVIYEYGKKVLKVYHTPKPTKFENHLKSLGNLDNRFVKPQQIWYTNAGLVGGFEMDYVDFNKYLLFNNLFNKGYCTINGIDKKLKIKILESLKDAIEFAHNKGIIIGDLNQYNIFVKKDGSVLFCDVDSFATQHQPHSGVLLDEIRDWTTTSINKDTDIWAYNILSFWSTTHVHPFKWVCPGNNESLEQRVRQNKSILSKIQGIKIPALYEQPDAVVIPQYEENFKGRRYYVNFNGVQTTNLVVNKQVTSTSMTIRELLTNVIKVRCSGNQLAVKTQTGWKLLETKFQGISREINLHPSNIDDEVFPGNEKCLVLQKDKLYSIQGLEQEFSNYYYYHNGNSLMIVDYNRDLQWNYNIDNQLAGVEKSQTPVFAKSILFNGCPIQNFGNKKFLNIPVGKSYTMYEVPFGTKTALYSQGYCVTESVEKNKVKFTLMKPSNHKLESGIELDYLPHFCVKGDLIFIPEDGFIGIYKDWTMITKLDCSCTRNSLLFATNSGIVMLENQSLYLLNTK